MKENIEKKRIFFLKQIKQGKTFSIQTTWETRKTENEDKSERFKERQFIQRRTGSTDVRTEDVRFTNHQTVLSAVTFLHRFRYGLYPRVFGSQYRSGHNILGFTQGI